MFNKNRLPLLCCLLLLVMASPIQAQNAKMKRGASLPAGQAIDSSKERLRAAAEDGDSESQYILANCYSYGVRGFRKDEAEAAVWYRKAAQQGHREAQYCLALVYSLGKGVPSNQSEACKWYRKAAYQDHTEAQLSLALSLSDGNGVLVDHLEAYAWYSILMEKDKNMFICKGWNNKTVANAREEEWQMLSVRDRGDVDKMVEYVKNSIKSNLVK